MLRVFDSTSASVPKVEQGLILPPPIKYIFTHLRIYSHGVSFSGLRRCSPHHKAQTRPFVHWRCWFLNKTLKKCVDFFIHGWLLFSGANRRGESGYFNLTDTDDDGDSRISGVGSYIGAATPVHRRSFCFKQLCWKIFYCTLLFQHAWCLRISGKFKQG